MIIDWSKYELPEGAVVARPWWVRGDCPGGCNYRRADGLRLSELRRPTEDFFAAMERIDRERPLPVPRPRCGQVWVRPVHEVQDFHVYEYASESAVTKVRRERHKGDKKWRLLVWIDWTCGRTLREWPPPGGVLVEGPGAPWAPPELSSDGGADQGKRLDELEE